jgi:hypothetical protein
MKIKNASKLDIVRALEHVNTKFSTNVEFNRFDYNPKNKTAEVTLRVFSSKGPGAHIAVSGRRTIAACWHVWGEFMSSFPSYVEFRTSYFPKTVIHPDDKWHDRVVVDNYLYGTIYASELCDCWKIPDVEEFNSLEITFEKEFK